MPEIDKAMSTFRARSIFAQGIWPDGRAIQSIDSLGKVTRMRVESGP